MVKPKIELVDYSETFLDKSWQWLNDPEIKRLTNTPDFTKEGQKRWFENLKNNISYWVRGISYGGEPIGVVGLKNIDFEKKTAEYFGYIGEKDNWGKGLSKQLLPLVFEYAKNTLKLTSIYLNVIVENQRAIKAYQTAGFREIVRDNKNIKMILIL